MPYSTFTLDSVRDTFGLSIDFTHDLFVSIPEVTVSSTLQEFLHEHVPLAFAINTEKARSELIVVPVLLEVRRLLNRQVSLFSGVEFAVDAERGLSGICDFILSLSPDQLFLNAPVLLMVEAKNENIKSGLAQCIAEMVAAQLFNERKGNNIKNVYGAITSGSIWKFLCLNKDVVCVDQPEYHIERIGKILAILLAVCHLDNKKEWKAASIA